MDKNKLEVLRAIGFEIRQTCASCAHSDLQGRDYGYCGAHTYQHGKHKVESFLSIKSDGWCLTYKPAPTIMVTPGFEEFVK